LQQNYILNVNNKVVPLATWCVFNVVLFHGSPVPRNTFSIQHHIRIRASKPKYNFPSVLLVYSAWLIANVSDVREPVVLSDTARLRYTYKLKPTFCSCMLSTRSFASGANDRYSPASLFLGYHRQLQRLHDLSGRAALQKKCRNRKRPSYN